MRAPLFYTIVLGACISVGSASAQDIPGLTDEEFTALEQTEAYQAMRPPQKLNFSEEDVVDFVGADRMYRTVEVTAHAESGSGFMDLGKVAFRSCRVAVTLVTQPS